MTTEAVKKVAEIKVSYHSQTRPEERPVIQSSKDAYTVFRESWSDLIEYQEEFNILLLNHANHVIAFYNVSKGGTASTLVDVKTIFSVALVANASFIILAHNHPSGILRPSDPDIKLTAKLKQAGEHLDIKILDHLILTPYGYYSFTDEAIL